MAFPERFSNLPDYAFPRLRKLLDAHAPGGPQISMTIGEPRHPMPDFVGQVLAENLDGFAVYPPNDGTPELLAAISAWVQRRYGVGLDTDRLMVLNGTREGLYNACIALCPEQKNGKAPVVLMPNPFYQVYAVAALTVGAEPVYVPATAATGFLPDYASLPADVLDRTTIAYICSPANPTSLRSSPPPAFSPLLQPRWTPTRRNRPAWTMSTWRWPPMLQPCVPNRRRRNGWRACRRPWPPHNAPVPPRRARPACTRWPASPG